ncbi:MAG: NADH-quinone oxidoreductase subunit C, partial [Pseudomonadota bacterium]
MAVADLPDLKAYLDDELENELDGSAIEFDELTLTTTASNVHAVLRFLRDDVQTSFICFIDMCAVDYPQRRQRFDIVYHLLSPRQNLRVRVKLATDTETPVPS